MPDDEDPFALDEAPARRRKQKGKERVLRPVALEEPSPPELSLAEQYELHHPQSGMVEKVRQLQRDRTARRIVDDEEALKLFTVPPSRPTLADELAIKDGPLRYSIDRLHPLGSNTVVEAKYKAGKTTMMANLFKSLADQSMFLGEFPVIAAPGKVAFWNYELSDMQMRKWLREVDVKQQDNAVVLNLRGYRVPLTVEKIEDWVVDWLKEHNVGSWIIDPYSRAYGGNENDNTEIGRWTEAVDVIKRRAGVQNVFMPVHFGRGREEEGEERARGGARLDDWADVRWILTTQDDVRYFRAHGRDVDLSERQIGFDPATRALTVDGGSRKQARREKAVTKAVEAVVAAVTEQPGIGTTDLRKVLTGTTQRKNEAIAKAIEDGKVTKERVGKNTHHYPTGSTA